jgi:hypothetical protein
LGAQASPGKPNAAAVQSLIAAAHMAFKLYPGNCSGAVHYVIKSIVDPTAPYHVANALMQGFALRGSGWHQVTIAEASELANQGIVVVGGATANNNGHVVIVLPGPLKPSGGYIANGQMMPNKGMFPPAMSTSLGAWPGAISDGDKTVFDAWGSPQLFGAVTFWTPDK